MTKQEIVKELRTILKTYHYESDEQHISKDVVTSLEIHSPHLPSINLAFLVPCSPFFLV